MIGSGRADFGNAFWFLLFASSVSLLAASPLESQTTKSGADETRDVDREEGLSIAEMDARIAYLTKLEALATAEENLAETYRSIAVKRKDTAQARLELIQKERQAAKEKLVPPIKTLLAEVRDVTHGAIICNAFDRIRYECEGKENCTFVNDQTICGMAQPVGSRFLLEGSYSCNGKTLQVAAGFGATAYLTCYTVD